MKNTPNGRFQNTEPAAQETEEITPRIQPEVRRGKRLRRVFLTTLCLPSLWLCLAHALCVAQAVKSDEQLRITHVPVIEEVTDTTATIAWSTNLNAGTQL